MRQIEKILIGIVLAGGVVLSIFFAGESFVDVVIILIAEAVIIYFITLERRERKKKHNLLICQAQAIVTEIAVRCSSDASRMRYAVEDAARICEEGLMDNTLGYAISQSYGNAAPAFRAAYDKGDYILFAYLSALHYASRYVEDDPERQSIEKYCKPLMRSLETRNVRESGLELRK